MLKFKTEYPRNRHRVVNKKIARYNESMNNLIKEIQIGSENSMILPNIELDSEILKQVLGEFIQPSINSAYMKKNSISMLAEVRDFIIAYNKC